MDSPFEDRCAVCHCLIDQRQDAYSRGQVTLLDESVVDVLVCAQCYHPEPPRYVSHG